MKEIINRELRETKDGDIIELSEIIIFSDDQEVTRSYRILKTPYGNQEIEVSDDTKMLIEQIARGVSK